MTLQEIYKICPDVKLIGLDNLIEFAKKVSGDDSFQLDLTKTFGEQGFDELDCVEIIMKLENKLNISIHDDVADFIVSIDSKPDFLLQVLRENQINKILND